VWRFREAAVEYCLFAEPLMEAVEWEEAKILRLQNVGFAADFDNAR
jgi:hypothetical protein